MTKRIKLTKAQFIKELQKRNLILEYYATKNAYDLNETGGFIHDMENERYN